MLEAEVNKFTHDAVVADVSETHIRFAVVHTDRLTIEDYVQFGKNVFGSVVEALAAYRRSLPTCPPALGITIANSELLPVSDLERRLAEGHAGEWHHIQIIGSIDALSLILPDLAPHDVVQFGGAEARRDAAKAVASIGDALGVGVLAQINGSCPQFHAHAGSISFAPRTQEELDILERIRCDTDHVSVEHVLSDRGLAHLYQILRESSGQPVRSLQATDIVIAGLQGDDRCATTAINYFATWLGRFAGDMALLYDARGGVYLWGPILRKMEKLLHNGAFRLAFEAKGRRSDWLTRIPVFLIRSEDAILRGAAKALNQQMD
ncbi:glucokinase [Sinorhizobium sp. 7-81]|uniref:glucokinase n=1 Tax=Sinorhizobium sp. 8-89 TaxID=3049089 RepID=UPI0024C2DCE1|nr:glucokinase [Sinorhizobium sp. 8-89]MDK1491231.1 glucokinase [Sinorhizobium sp. 8-89]